MKQVVAAPSVAPEPLPPDTAAHLSDFARACKAAARSVALYPPEHPAVAAALTTLASAAKAATSAGALKIAVLPDALTIDGRGLARSEMAVTELAALLHAHQVGQLTVQPLTDADMWRRFLVLVALPPDQARLRGGLARLWSSEGQTRIEVRRVDYAELLRERIRGDRATWQAVVAGCLEGDAATLDDWTVELLLDVLDHPERVGELVEALEKRVVTDSDRGPLIVATLLQSVAQFVGRTQPDQLDTVLSAMAEATGRLPVETLAPLVAARQGDQRPELGQFVRDLVSRMKDSTIAEFVATEVRGGRGASARMADAFCGLAPDPDRRSAILALARDSLERSGMAGDPPTQVMWQQSEERLLTYSDKPFVSDAYNSEIQHLSDRAVDLDRDLTDPPPRMAAWRRTVDEENLRLLDARCLADLMALQHDGRHWRELGDLTVARINVLVVVGDFHAATFLVEALRQQAQRHSEPRIQGAAAEALDRILNPAMMRHVASHFDTADKDLVASAKGFCHAIGTMIVSPLAEVLSREERTRSRQHLVEVLIGLGAAGRQAVERLIQSPNAAVRRTAVLLLREFGGQDALGELEALLHDSEPHVQRDATRAIAQLGIDAAYNTLTRALVSGSEHTRTVITGVLWTLPDNDAVPTLAHVLRHAPCGGAMWHVHERAIQRLGSAGGHVAVEALTDMMYRGSVWTPFHTSALRRHAADALARIGTSEALASLRAAAADGPWGTRSAARRHVASAAQAAAIARTRS